MSMDGIRWGQTQPYMNNFAYRGNEGTDGTSDAQRGGRGWDLRDPKRASDPLDAWRGENDPLKPAENGDDDAPLSQEEIHRRLTGRKSTPSECETCKNRMYQDGSDEMVSFKAAGHIDPSNAASVVMGHEQEHVSNAYQKAANNNGEVVRASVRLKTGICPECGRTFIAGGETTTQIRYFNEDNPYQQSLKGADAASKYRGANVDVPA